METHGKTVRKRTIPANVGFTFAVDIMSNAPTSDVAVKFADYVFENYIDVDSKFPPTLWAQPPDVSGAIPHTNNGAEAYHSHLNADCETSQHIYVCRCTEEGSANSVCCHEQCVAASTCSQA